jgi:hypothetical protein
MIAARRASFNSSFSRDRYAVLQAVIAQRANVPIEFRLSETPCFFAASLLSTLVDAAQEMTQQLLTDDAYRAEADAVVPARFRLANTESLPTFLQVDFGLVKTGAGFEGRLVELQAFPSLYAFQPTLAEACMEVFGLEGVTPFLGGLDHEDYVRLMARVLIGPHDPSHVVLMEIDPARQKTRPDFSLTERLWGIRAVDVTDVVRESTRLFYRRDGRLTPIARVYNRVIPDELVRRNIELPFDYRDELDVEWLGGPDWYFRISKFSIPFLRHPWVPATHFLHTLDALPADRENWLLKPLFSFAGGGIVFAPTDEQIAAIPSAERDQYILQERVSFTPVIDTPHGLTQAELRIMFVRDDARYRAVLPLVRMGRGKMMGVDYNKNLEWVGAAAALIDPAV